MEVLEFIYGKLKHSQSVLQELIARYNELPDVTRLEKSNTVFDHLRSYLRIKNNLLLPYIQQDGRFNNMVENSNALSARIHYVLDHAVMIHVDEPSCEYHQELVTLNQLLTEMDQYDHEHVYPWLRAHLKEEQHRHIAEHLEEQMTHESLPSSGMTIY